MYFYFYFLLYVYYFFYLFSIFSVLVIHKSTMWINSQVNKQQICTNHCHSLEHQQRRNTLLKVQKLFFTLFYCFILPCSLTHSCSIVHRFLPVAGCDDSNDLNVSGHCKKYRAGVNVDVTPRTGGPVGHAPDPVAPCDTQRAGKEIVKRPTSK